MQGEMIRSVVAGADYFVRVFVAGFILGTLRTLYLEPAMGSLAAVAVELPVILAWSWIACGWVLTRRPLSRRATPRLVMGLSAFALLMLAEIALTLGFGQSVADWIASLGTPAELLGLTGQVFFALVPLVRR